MVKSALGGMFRIIEVPDVMHGDLVCSLYYESPRIIEILRLVLSTDRFTRLQFTEQDQKTPQQIEAQL